MCTASDTEHGNPFVNINILPFYETWKQEERNVQNVFKTLFPAVCEPNLSPTLLLILVLFCFVFLNKNHYSYTHALLNTKCFWFSTSRANLWYIYRKSAILKLVPIHDTLGLIVRKSDAFKKRHLWIHRVRLYISIEARRKGRKKFCFLIPLFNKINRFVHFL